MFLLRFRTTNNKARQQLHSILKRVVNQSISHVYPEIDEKEADKIAENISQDNLGKIEEILATIINEETNKIVSRKVGW